ncbi:MAG: phosphatase PAP2 family protein [Bacteroidota bacterium]
MKRAGLFVILILVGFGQLPAQNADINLLKNINLHRNRSLDPAFKFISNSVTPLSIAVPIGAITCAIVRKDSAGISNAIVLSSAAIVVSLVTTSIKYSVNRPRPYTTWSFIDHVTSMGSPSFPSGHTSQAFALATSLSIAYPKWYVITPSFLWAAAVGYSRMDLGVHYPSDVAAGALVGAGSAFLSYEMNRLLFHKHFKKEVTQ